MAGETVDLVISNGLERTSRAFQTLERYFDRLRKQAKTLSRFNVQPTIRIGDPFRSTRAQLQQLTKANWNLSLTADLSIGTGTVADEGKQAGEAFTEKFLFAFDADKVADKLMDSINKLVSKMDNGNSGSNLKKENNGFIEKTGGWFLSVADSWGKDKVKKITDYGLTKGLDKLIGKMNDTSPMKTFLSTIRNAAFGEKKDNPAADCCCSDGKSSGIAIPSPGNQIYIPGSKKKPQTLVDVNGKPFVKQPKGSPILTAAKNMFKNFNKSFGSSTGFSSPHPMGFNLAANPFSSVTQSFKTRSKSLMNNSVLKAGGKLFRPLSVASDLMNIAAAKPGEERNKAIGGALGGWGGAAAGAAIGSAILPGVGTVIGGAIGGLAGGSAGEFIGGKLGGAAKKAKSFIGNLIWGKKKDDAVSVPTPTESHPAVGNAPRPAAQAAGLSVNVNLPVGAIQLSVQENVDYDEISVLIGSKITASIQQAMENRA